LDANGSLAGVEEVLFTLEVPQLTTHFINHYG